MLAAGAVAGLADDDDAGVVVDASDEATEDVSLDCDSLLW